MFDVHVIFHRVDDDRESTMFSLTRNLLVGREAFTQRHCNKLSNEIFRTKILIRVAAHGRLAGDARQLTAYQMP